MKDNMKYGIRFELNDGGVFDEWYSNEQSRDVSYAQNVDSPNVRKMWKIQRETR